MRPANSKAACFVRRSALLGALAFAGAALVTFPAQAALYDEFLSLYDGLLESYVEPSAYRGVNYNGVDYDGWARDARHERAKDALLASDPGAFFNKEERLAYWINAYNFLTIDLIVREGERDSIRNLGTLFRTPWQAHTWMVGDRMRTLDDIEHDIIRPMGEPRIHFAVNCAALSCPNLRPEPYRAEELDRQLDEQVRLTLDDPTKGFRVDPNRDQVMVSKVFQWFGEDFDDGDLRAWLETYKPDPFGPDTRISFLRYDWGLNDIM